MTIRNCALIHRSLKTPIQTIDFFKYNKWFEIFEVLWFSRQSIDDLPKRVHFGTKTNGIWLRNGWKSTPPIDNTGLKGRAWMLSPQFMVDVSFTCRPGKGSNRYEKLNSTNNSIEVSSTWNEVEAEQGTWFSHSLLNIIAGARYWGRECFRNTKL